jgi:hypothetical protein
MLIGSIIGSIIGKLFPFLFLFVVVIIPVVVITVSDMFEIDPVDYDSKNFGIHLKEGVFGLIQGLPRGFSAQHYQNDPIDRVRKDE